MMDAPETATLTVPARREAFAALSAWLEARLAPLNPSPKARRQLLLAAIGAFASSAPQADDITLLTVTYDG